MNKFLHGLLIVLFPFYPLWAWLCYTVTKKPLDLVLNVLLIPFAIHFFISLKKRLPLYVKCLLLFTTYHICSAYINNAIPKNTNFVYFVLSDPNVLACSLFIIIGNLDFDKRFIHTMTRNIFVIVIISLIVSLVQIKYPSFFFNATSEDDLFYLGENRNFSIYSWTNLNSCGITFPILLAILISVWDTKKSTFPIIVISGIVVSFLTRARYIMISFLVVLSQTFFNKKRSALQRGLFIVLFGCGILFIGFVAENLGFDVDEVINNRILEKNSDLESAKSRVLSYEVFLSVFPKHPLVGVGPSTKSDVIEMLGGEAPLIHVGYLSYLYFYGIAGSAFLFAAIFFLLRDAWRVGKKSNFWGSFYGLVSFCLANLTFVYFNVSEMGIIIAVIYIRHFSVKYEMDYPEVEIEEGTYLVSNTKPFERV